MDTVREIETGFSVLRLSTNGIIILTPREDVPPATKGLDEAKLVVDAAKELCADGPKPALIFMSDNPLDDEARRHYVENIHISMAAVVGSSFMGRMMANLLLNFKKLPIPVRLFSEEKNARAWIKEKLLQEKAKRA